MGKRVFQKAGEPVLAILRDMVELHHRDLKEAGARVGVILVWPPTDKDGWPTAPAVVVHGVAAAACIKLVSRRDRVFKAFDAEMQIDADRWEELTVGQRAALIDHELTHLTVVRDQNNKVRTDDDTRPVLKLRPDDWSLTGFAGVAARHGEDALEVAALRTLYDRHGQLLFPWAGKSAPQGGGPPDQATGACARCGATGVTLTSLQAPGGNSTPPVCPACLKQAVTTVQKKKRKAG